MCSMETLEVPTTRSTCHCGSPCSHLCDRRWFVVLTCWTGGTLALRGYCLYLCSTASARHPDGREVSNSSRTSCSFPIIESALQDVKTRCPSTSSGDSGKRGRLSTLAWSERAVASLITVNTQVPCIKSTVTDAFRSGSEMA